MCPLNDFLKHLPKVTVQGKELRFVNAIGFGIDGLACEIADEKKAQGAKKIDYTSITIKALLFKYKRPNATVIVDGVEHKYKKVYLASAMKGRFYGGGMNVAPKQDRNGDTLTFVTFYKKNRLKTLMVFPSIFKGEHVKHTEMVDMIVGKTITVTFDIPTALQVDGDVFHNVTTYTVTAE